MTGNWPVGSQMVSWAPTYSCLQSMLAGVALPVQSARQAPQEVLSLTNQINTVNTMWPSVCRGHCLCSCSAQAMSYSARSPPALPAERAGSGAEDEEPASPVSQMDDSAGSAATAVDAAVVGILDTDALRRSMAGGSPTGVADCARIDACMCRGVLGCSCATARHGGGSSKSECAVFATVSFSSGPCWMLDADCPEPHSSRRSSGAL